MAWFRAVVHHGMGHQSTSTIFKYVEKRMSWADRKAWQDEVCEMYAHSEVDRATVWIARVRTLPESEWRRRRESATNMIRIAQRTLAVLARTKVNQGLGTARHLVAKRGPVPTKRRRSVRRGGIKK